jgi:hypothetical protein
MRQAGTGIRDGWHDPWLAFLRNEGITRTGAVLWAGVTILTTALLVVLTGAG